VHLCYFQLIAKDSERFHCHGQDWRTRRTKVNNISQNGNLQIRPPNKCLDRAGLKSRCSDTPAQVVKLIINVPLLGEEKGSLVGVSEQTPFGRMVSCRTTKVTKVIIFVTKWLRKKTIDKSFHFPYIAFLWTRNWPMLSRLPNRK